MLDKRPISQDNSDLYPGNLYPSNSYLTYPGGKAMGWLKEFRDFINRGSVIDLAVGVAIGRHSQPLSIRS